MLDLRTILFSHLATSLLGALVMAAIWRQYRRRYDGTAYWLADFMLQFAGAMLLGLRGQIPDWISMVVANTMVVAGAWLGYLGLQRFMGQVSRQWHNAILLVVFVVVHSYFCLVHPNLNARNLNTAMGLSLILGQCTWLMLHGRDPDLHAIAKPVGVVLGLFLLLTVTHVPIRIYWPLGNEDYLRGGLHEILFLLGYQLLLLLFAFALALLVNSRLQRELQAQEEKYAMAFTSAAYAITLTRLEDGKILEVNAGFEHMLGYSPAEVAGRTTLELHLWEHDQDRAAMLADVLSGKPIHDREVTLRKKSGELVHCLYSGTLLLMHGQQWLLSNIIDLTERKQAEAALSASEARYRSILQASPDAIMITDAHSLRQLMVSPGAVRMFGGTSTADLVGLLFTDFMMPAEQARVVAQINRLRRGDSPGPTVYRGRRLDGRELDLEANSEMILDVHQVPVHIVTIIRDITERRQAEAEKARLEAQNRHLQKADSLGRMAAAIAHRFNNYLQVMMGNLELAMDDQPGATSPGAPLSEAMQAAREAAQVSSLMLTYLGHTNAQREPLPLGDWCQVRLPQVAARLPSAVVLATDLPLPGPIVGADASQLEQVLTNLFTNASEALGEAGGTVQVTITTISRAALPHRHRFPLNWEPAGAEYACLEVADSGCGIAPADLEQIFDPFFSRKFTGRGLGLPVVLGIVRSHGGAIAVTSTPGRGSSFQVFLPLESAAASPLRASPTAPVAMPMLPDTAPAPGPDATVLLVEDEKPVRDAASLALKRLGYQVLEAVSGSDAVALFPQHRTVIVAVLCDLTMPGMDGWATLTALRHLEPALPVILASGYSQAQVMAGQHAELPQALLSKPYESAALSTTLARVTTGYVPR